jgi:hypothetical protein
MKIQMNQNTYENLLIKTNTFESIKYNEIHKAQKQPTTLIETEIH